MDKGKEELYKYIRDQHDKLITARESLISRFGNIRLLAGLLLTIFSFSIGIIAKSVENAQANLSRIIACSPIIVLGIALYYVTKALMTTPGLVGNVDVHIPAPDENERKEFEKAFERESLNADNILSQLGGNYLQMIGENLTALELARIDLDRCGCLIRRGIVFTIIFLIMTLSTNVIVMWVLPKG